MSRFTLKLLTGLAFLATAAEPSSAGAQQPNFFDLLFGNHPRRMAPPPSPSQQWWQDQQNQSDGQVIVPPQRQRKKHTKPAVVTPDPAPPPPRVASAAANQSADTSEDPQLTVPGLGLGMVDYVPPLTVPLYDPTLATLKADTAEGENIRQLLSQKANPIRGQDVERKAVIGFYRSNGFKPIWVEGGHLAPKAQELLKLFAAAGEEGLSPKNYLPEVLGSYDNPEASVAGDANKAARLDVGLTLASLRYARHVSAGQFEPNRLSLYNDMRPDAGNADELVRAIATASDPSQQLQSLAPQMPQYAAFKAALGHIGPSVAFEKIGGGKSVQPGKSDPRIAQLRKRLTQLGQIPSADAADPTNLDQDLVIGLMAYQTSMKMKPTGVLDAATVASLNKDDTASRREKLIASMERLRWLPKNLQGRYVFVNQAAFDVHVMDHDKPIWTSRVIVGQTDKQTFAFYDNIQTVVFNPRWGVPVSIIINEYAPKMRKDPNYLTDNGFIVTDLKGNEIDPQSVDWNNISLTPDFTVQQLAGGDNALGELKFLFPNAHDIYMHDTPTKPLFKKPVRAFSHGCVRVENPREFAQVLLGWSKEAVAKSLAISDTHSEQLAQKVPVYLTYFTAWTDDKGEVVYHDDIYQRDAAITKAMAYNPNPKPAAPAVAQDATVTGGLIQN